MSDKLFSLIVIFFALVIPVLIIIFAEKRRRTRFSARNELLPNEQEKEVRLKSTCPRCGQVLSDSLLKCANCGEWVANELFHRLTKEEVELIKSGNLNPITPNMVALMLLDQMQGDLERISKTKQTNILPKLLFFAHCYAMAINLSAKKKMGKEKSLNGEINSALMKQALRLISSDRSRAKPALSSISYATKLFSLLDRVDDEFPYDPEFPSGSEFLITQKLGQIVYGDKSSIPLGMELYIFRLETLTHLGKAFSHCFIVEEEDFDLEKASGGCIV